MADNVKVHLQKPINLISVRPSDTESDRRTARRYAVQAVLELIRARALGGGEQARLQLELEDLSGNADLIEQALLLTDDQKSE